MEYQARFDTVAVVRLSDNMIIGPEHAQEWAEYMAWVSQGNKPLEPEPLPVYTPPTIEEKLASVGLSISDLKSALGLS
jgi:hypothetical protein